MKESSMTSRSSRRTRRHRSGDQSGGILAVLANNSPAVKAEQAVKKEPPTTVPVKKKQPPPPPSTCGNATPTPTESTSSSVPPAIIFAPRQLSTDKQQQLKHKDDDEDDAFSELTSELGASLRTTKSASSSKSLTSPASPISEEDEEEETESEEDEEEDCSSSEEESSTESSEEDDASSESDGEGSNTYKKQRVRVGDAEKEDCVDDDSEIEYDNDDEYDPDGDNTESEDEDDEDDSSEELEMDEDDIRVTQKARTTNSSVSSCNKMNDKANTSTDKQEDTSDDKSDQSMNDKGHFSDDAGKGMVPYGDTTDDEVDCESKENKMNTSDEVDCESKENKKNTSRTSEGAMCSTSIVVCESQMQDSDDESVAVAHIVDEPLAIDDESVLEVEVESNQPDDEGTGFLEEAQRTPPEDEVPESGILTDIGESFSENQISTEKSEKEEVGEDITAVDENRLAVARAVEPVTTNHLKGGKASAQSTDEKSECLSECDDDFIAETSSFAEEEGVQGERAIEVATQQEDVNCSTTQQSVRLVVPTERIEIPPLVVEDARTSNTTEELSDSLDTVARDRKETIPEKLNRGVEKVSASNQSADIIAHVKLAENGGRGEQKSNQHVSLGQAKSSQSQARQKLFPRTRSEGSIKQGQWTLGSRIGTGSFGVVHMGMNHRNGSLMAVKSIPMQPAIMSDIRREIELLKSLNHTNVVKYYGAEINASGLHIFQEWVAGGSVSDLLSKFGPLPFPVIQSYAEQTLKGLAYLHTNNILHRDIKGSNLLVSDEGIVKLADFGGSRKLAEVNADMMMSMTLRGTPYFMAPEVFEQRYSSKADIWSVGCVMYEMVTATAPWKQIGFNNPFKLCRHLQNTEGPPQLPRTLPAADGNVLNNFLSAMAQCFHRTPFDRPCSVVLLQHPFFTDRGYSSEDEYSDSPGLFSPEVIRTQAGRLTSPSRAFRASPRPVASPVRNHSMRTPPRPQTKTAASGRSPFLSPPLPTRTEKPGASPKPYTPGKDTSGWPEWAKKKYESDQRKGASPMLDSLAFSSDSSVRPPSDALQNTASVSCLQGLQFLSLTDPVPTPASSKDI